MTKTTLLVARHGNTFDKGDILLRVGARTDLSLSESGKAQASALGEYLREHYPIIDTAYTSTLKRTIETASIALSCYPSPPLQEPLGCFDEIDYGEDDGKPEDAVIARIGQEALDRWDTDATPPEGWHVDIDAIKQNWKHFASMLLTSYSGQTILVVTSNGIARFAPYILDNPDIFMASNNIKLSTGALACLSYEKGKWHVEYWNKRPE